MDTCPNHPHRKIKAKGLCGSCYDKQLKKTNLKYHEAQKANTSKWMKLNSERRKQYNELRNAAYHAEAAKNPETFALARRNAMLKKTYGMTHEDYEHMVTRQGGGCAICGRKTAKGKHLHVDHCHVTGKVRGALCHQCNWYLGTIDADPLILERIYEYRNKK